MATAAAAQASVFSWAGKGSGRAVAVATQLTKKEVLSASAVLGAGVVFVEARRGKLLMALGDATAEAAIDGGDDIASLAGKLPLPQPGIDSPRRFVLTQQSASELGPDLGKLTAHGEVFVVEPVMGPLRVSAHATVGQVRYFKQLRPGLLTAADVRISVDAARALTEPIRREGIRVASMYAVTDVEAIAKLANAAGDRLLPPRALAKETLAQTLGDMRGGILVVAGHVEDAAFVARNARGELVHTLPFNELENLAAAADVKIISAGCSTFCSGAGAGFAARVTDTQVAEAVRSVFKSDDTAGMLATFGKDQPFFLSQETLDGFAESRRLKLTQLQAGSAAANSTALGLRMYSAARNPTVLQFVAVTLGPLYLTGLVCAALMFRTTRAAFLRNFPRLPSPELPGRQVAHIAARVGRILLFLAVGPILALIVVVFMLFGGWTRREDLMSGLWFVLRHPFLGGLAMLRVAVSLLELIVVYGLGLAILLMPLGMLAAWTFGDTASPFFWPLLGLTLAALAVAIWAGLKGRRRLDDWLAGHNLIVRN